jgi:aryl-alcohol dehydrogenase-like predicted oxidoreductase
MKRNMLGKTGIAVSELSYGTLSFSRHQANLTEKEGGRCVKSAFDLGINLPAKPMR